VFTVNVLEPDPFTDVGLKPPVAPEGNPETPQLTVPLKPFIAVVETVYVVEPPGAMVCAPGIALSEKSGGGPALVTVQLPNLAQPLSAAPL
jgi:hypothetical protein